MNENPYSAPRSDPEGLPEAPGSTGWEVAGKAVKVRRGAQFPMIDPYTARSEDPMRMQLMTVRHHPLWLWSIPFLASLVGAILAGRDDYIPAQALVGLFFGLVLWRITCLFFPQCTLMVFFEKRTLRFRNTVSGILGALFLVGILSGFFPQLQELWIPTATLSLWLAGLLAALAFNRRLRCRRRTGGDFLITGFHPAALARLRDFKSTNQSR